MSAANKENKKAMTKSIVAASILMGGTFLGGWNGGVLAWDEFYVWFNGQRCTDTESESGLQNRVR